MPDQDEYTPDGEGESPEAGTAGSAGSGGSDVPVEPTLDGDEHSEGHSFASAAEPPSADQTVHPGYPPPAQGYPPPHPGYPPSPYSGSQPWGPTEGWGPGQPPYVPDATVDLAQGGSSTTSPPSVDGEQAETRKGRKRVIFTVAVSVVVVALVAGILSAVLTSGGSSSGSSASAPVSPAARNVLDQAIAKAEAALSFHYVSVSSGTRQDLTTVGDAGRNSGKQQITTKDSSGSASFTVLVIGSACYFQGDALAMVENLGLSASVAQSYANQWISLAPSDSPYASVYAAVTLHDALSENITFKPQHLTSTKVGRQKVQEVSGATTPVTIAQQTQNVKGTATLDVSASTKLPIRYRETGTLEQQGQKSKLSFTMTFSDFGESVSESAPTGATAFSSLGGTSGGGGGGGAPILTSNRS